MQVNYFFNAIPLMKLLNKNKKVGRILQEFKISPWNHTFLKSGGWGLHADTHFSYKNKEIFFSARKNTIFIHFKILYEVRAQKGALLFFTFFTFFLLFLTTFNTKLFLSQFLTICMQLYKIFRCAGYNNYTL